MLSAVTMTDHEQLILELVNRARQNPAAEAATFGIDLNEGLSAGPISTSPKQPLAPHGALIDAAIGHTVDMLERDFFSHTNPDRIGSNTRMVAAGYDGTSTGENISVGTGGAEAIDPFDADLNAAARHRRLFLSEGHRVNMLREHFDEIGIGFREGTYTSNSYDYYVGMLTENFGGSVDRVYITGVAYDDRVEENDFFDIGESEAGLVVTAIDQSNGLEYKTVTGSSGGYALEVPSGTYTVTFAGGGYDGVVEHSEITIGADNFKLDLDTIDANWIAAPVPAIPTNLGPSQSTIVSNPTILTNTTPTFQWQSVTHASSYQLWVAPVGVSSGVISVITSETSFTPAKDLPTGSFRYFIRAINSQGEMSAFTEAHYFDVVPEDIPIPAVPVNIGPSQSTIISDPTELTDRTPTFQWQSATHASSYQLWVAPVGVSRGVFSVITSGSSVTPATDLPTGSYRYFIRSINSEGEWSAFTQARYFDVVPEDIPIPETPANLGPSQSTEVTDPAILTDATPTFQWQSVTHASSYQLWVAPVGVSSGVISIITSDTAFTPSRDLPSGRYRYFIRAINSEGEMSSFTRAHYFDVAPADIPVPAVPNNIGPSESVDIADPAILSDATPTFQWQSSANASSYQLWVAPVGVSSGVISVITSETVFSPSRDLPSGRYRYFIRAINSEGERSSFTQAHYFDVAPADIPVPAVPNNIGPSDSVDIADPAILSDATPTFQWQSSANASSYQLWVAPVGVSSGVISVITSDTVFTPSRDLPSGRYRYFIRAINSEGERSDFTKAYYFNIQ